MKYLFLLSVVIAACAASAIKDPTVGYKEGDRYFYFPGDDADDTLYLVDLEEPVDEEFLRQYERSADNNEYLLYTRSNPTTAQIIEMGNSDSVLNSNFDTSKTTVFIAHGWNGNGRNPMSQTLTEVFLGDDDVNIIVLDWSVAANRNYLTASNGVPAVGRLLGEFINWLVTLGADYDKMHLTGYSLGGQLIGIAGRQTGSRVRRLTALDPAGPLWGGNKERIVETDAQYVEIIHTNTLFYGFSDPCGDADFYPNGGATMPGCFAQICSHRKSVTYMASSVTHNHLLANECETLNDARRDRCSGTPTYPMGNSDLNKQRSGIFRVNTGKEYPY